MDELKIEADESQKKQLEELRTGADNLKKKVLGDIDQRFGEQKSLRDKISDGTVKVVNEQDATTKATLQEDLALILLESGNQLRRLRELTETFAFKINAAGNALTEAQGNLRDLKSEKEEKKREYLKQVVQTLISRAKNVLAK